MGGDNLILTDDLYVRVELSSCEMYIIRGMYCKVVWITRYKGI